MSISCLPHPLGWWNFSSASSLLNVSIASIHNRFSLFPQMLPDYCLSDIEVVLSSRKISHVLPLYALPNCYLSSEKCTMTTTAGTFGCCPSGRETILLWTAGTKTFFCVFMWFFLEGKQEGKTADTNKICLFTDNQIL